MIISVRIINKPRKQRKCDACGKPINGEQVRIYGAAYKGDPPWVIYLHRACCSTEVREKLGEE